MASMPYGVIAPELQSLEWMMRENIPRIRVCDFIKDLDHGVELAKNRARL